MTMGEVTGYLLLALIAVYTLRRAIIEVAVAVLGPKVAQRAAEAAENDRLASDADYEDAAFHSGDLRTAFFGRFPPPWVILHESGCTPDRCVRRKAPL